MARAERTDIAIQRAVFFAWSGGIIRMWREVVTLDGCRSASELDDDGDCRLGHRRIGRHRLGYCPQQDVRLRSRSSPSEPLAQQDQGLGQWRAYDLPSGLLGRRAGHARVLKGGLEFSAEQSLESGRTRLRCCMTRCQ